MVETEGTFIMSSAIATGLGFSFPGLYGMIGGGGYCSESDREACEAEVWRIEVIGRIRDFFSEIKPARAVSGDEDMAARIRIATCVLMMEVAHSDGHFTEAERGLIIEILKEKSGLTDGDAAELIELAREERKESADLWRFSNMIDNNYSREEKERVVESLWRIIYADKRLDINEDHLIHRLSKLLNLSHQQLIGAKKKVMGWD
jgi:uncharacterized tellurite resistance protein B-like protein